jgi:hypothetical protein
MPFAKMDACKMQLNTSLPGPVFALPRHGAGDGAFLLVDRWAVEMTGAVVATEELAFTLNTVTDD